MDDIATLQHENNGLLRDMKFLRKQLEEAQLTIKSMNMTLTDYYMGRAISGLMVHGAASDEAMARKARRIADHCMRFRTGESL